MSRILNRELFIIKEKNNVTATCNFIAIVVSLLSLFDLLRTRWHVCKLIAKKALRGNDPTGSNSSRGATLSPFF